MGQLKAVYRWYASNRRITTLPVETEHTHICSTSPGRNQPLLGERSSRASRQKDSPGYWESIGGAAAPSFLLLLRPWSGEQVASLLLSWSRPWSGRGGEEREAATDPPCLFHKLGTSWLGEGVGILPCCSLHSTLRDQEWNEEAGYHPFSDLGGYWKSFPTILLPQGPGRSGPDIAPGTFPRPGPLQCVEGVERRWL